MLTLKNGISPKMWLENEFLARKRRNSRYSIRAFAKFLDLPSGRVSQLLSGRRTLTLQLGEKISERLSYDLKTKELFLKTIERQLKQRKAVSARGFSATQNYRTLQMDQFKMIAKPIHYDILGLFKTSDFVSDEKWIAERLRVTLGEVRDALKRLNKLSLITLSEVGWKLSSSSGLTTMNDVPSQVIRTAHRSYLRSATKALSEWEVELRDITAITMAIDPALMPEAKEMIRDFRRRLCELLESGEKNEVYRLSIQLVPVSGIPSKSRGSK